MLYINKIYGFYDECLNHYGNDVWNTFTEVFNCLPIAAIIENKIFCVHGGLSPSLQSLDQIAEMNRPQEVPEDGVLCDLLWSDPTNETDDWEENERGTSYCYGIKPVESFLHEYGFDLICRAHQAIMDGFEFPFPNNQSVVTVFSAPNYCYEYENRGAILNVDDNLYCSFSQIDPIKYDVTTIAPGQRAGTPPRRENPDYMDGNGPGNQIMIGKH